MKKSLIIGIIALILAIFALILTFNFAKDYVGGSPDANRFDTITSGSATTSTTTIQQLLAKNASRSYAHITNQGTSTIFMMMSSTSTGAVANAGIQLTSGESYDINSENLYIGDIWLATSSVATKVLYIEQ